MRKFILVHEENYSDKDGKGEEHLIPTRKISRVKGYCQVSKIYFKEGFRIDTEGYMVVKESPKKIYKKMYGKKMKDKQEETEKTTKTE